MALLQIKNLSKTYSKEHIKVFTTISLAVNSGQIVSIIGPSGCGKTTLFNILSGIDNQTSGQILINDKHQTNRKGSFGYMTQDSGLLPWRSALDNVTLGQDILKKDKQKSRKNALNLLKKFGLLKFADFYPNKLSGGIKQRIALLRTILFNKDFLLLDEPFGALDQITRISCQMFLLDLKKKLNPTIFFITHDVREAIFLSDTIYVLSPAPAKILKKFDVQKSKNPQDLQKKILKLLINKHETI